MQTNVFLSEIQSILKGRFEHADPSEKWRYTQGLRKLESWENRRNISDYVTLQSKNDGFNASDLQEKIIAEYLLPAERVVNTVGHHDPDFFQSRPLLLTESTLKRMATGVPGSKVVDVAFENNMRVSEVKAQLAAYVEKKQVTRVHEVASGEVRKLRFESSLEKLPETFFDRSTYQSRLTGVGDCAAIALAVSEKKSYQVSAAALSDIEQESGGVRTIDFQEYLLRKGYFREPMSPGIVLEGLWHSDLISVSDAGVFILATEGDSIGNHAIGFRDGKMHVSDPVLASQLFASSEVLGVYKRQSQDATVIANAIMRQATTRTPAPAPIHESIPTSQAELEALKTSLVNEIMTSLSAQLGVTAL